MRDIKIEWASNPNLPPKFILTQGKVSYFSQINRLCWWPSESNIDKCPIKAITRDEGNHMLALLDIYESHCVSKITRDFIREYNDAN